MRLLPALAGSVFGTPRWRPVVRGFASDTELLVREVASSAVVLRIPSFRLNLGPKSKEWAVRLTVAVLSLE